MQSSTAPRVILFVLVAVAFSIGLWVGNMQRDASNATAIVNGVRAGIGTPCPGVTR